MSASFCGVPSPKIIYAGPGSREEFDLIALPEMLHAWKADSSETFLRNDGQQWERRCHSKTLGELGRDPVCVIFQWFEARPVGAADAAAQSAEIPDDLNTDTPAPAAPGGAA